MWNSPAAKAPTPSCSTMNPIWPDVDHTRPPFTSVRTSITAVATSAVSIPTAKASVMATDEEPKIGEKRMRSTPAPLTTPAWSSADTGVGAASVDGSQRWIGTSAERATPATTSSTATIVSALESRDLFGTQSRHVRSDRAQVDVTDGCDRDDHRHEQGEIADQEARAGRPPGGDRRRPRCSVADQRDQRRTRGDPGDDQPRAGRRDGHRCRGSGEQECEDVEPACSWIPEQRPRRERLDDEAHERRERDEHGADPIGGESENRPTGAIGDDCTRRALDRRHDEDRCRSDERRGAGTDRCTSSSEWRETEQHDRPRGDQRQSDNGDENPEHHRYSNTGTRIPTTERRLFSGHWCRAHQLGTTRKRAV